MAENTKIAWATHSWSPWLGCSHVHTGCANCYAEAMAGRMGVTWGPNGTRRRTAASTWKHVERWNRKAACNCYGKDAADGLTHLPECPQHDRPRVFPSLCDPFEKISSDCVFGPDNRPIYEPVCSAPNFRDPADWRRCGLSEIRRDFFALIDRCQNLDFLLLTKRPENIRRMWTFLLGGFTDGSKSRGFNRQNVWLLYSASDQATLDAGLPHLLSCRDLVSVVGLRIEPLLGPIDLGRAFDVSGAREIVSGASGNRDVQSRRSGEGMATKGGEFWQPKTEDVADKGCTRIESGDGYQTGLLRNPVRGRREANVRSSASDSLDDSQRFADSRWASSQPQERKSKGQPAVKSGSRDSEGKHEARGSGTKDPREAVSTRPEEFERETDCGTSCGDKDSSEGRGVELQTNCEDVQRVGSEHLPHQQRKNVVTRNPAIDWVIVGGESGPHARPCNVDWIRSIRDQCREAGVPCFVKQLGTACQSDLECELSQTYAYSGRPHDPKGGDPSEWPEDLRVQEFPR